MAVYAVPAAIADSESESIIGLRATWAPTLMRSAMKGKGAATGSKSSILSTAIRNSRSNSAGSSKPLVGGVQIGVPKASVTGPAPTFTLGTATQDALSPTTASISSGRTIMLQGGVQETVPKTPDEVANYFKRMKKIINEYDQVAVSALLNSSGGLNTDPDSIEAARAQTLTLVSRINTTVPPAELKTTHETLAVAMAHVGDFMANGTQAGLLALPRAFSLISELKGAMDSYHNGVLTCINNYHLELSNDPFSSEDAQTAERLNAGLGQFQQQKINDLQRSSQPQQPTYGADMVFGGGGSSFGSNDVGTPSASGPGSLFGSSGGGGDPSAALGALGGLLGGGGNGGLGSILGGGGGNGSGLGSIFGGGAGQSGGGAGLGGALGPGGIGGALGPGGLGGMLGGNSGSGGGDLGALQGLLGGSGGGNGQAPDPAALLKGLTSGNGQGNGQGIIEQFGNLMKQLNEDGQ